MTAAFAQLLLLGPLIVYALFEAMVIYDGRSNSMLLLLYAAMAGLALWKTAGVLLKPVPLEFTEPMSRAVTPADAPEFWAAVREAATCLETAPPDHIVVGMRMSFYVTELAVIHSAGRVEGRTLFLSQPLLKHLSPYEVLAIVGHELGHFLGDDTRLTREFYPLRQKAHDTMHALRECGPGAWTTIQSLDFFSACFAATTQTFSRQRELLADRLAADMTSPETVARALVKFQIASEAFDLGFAAAVRDGAANPYNLALGPLIRERLLPAPQFWAELFAMRLPHPLDSHPDLHARLAALGQNLGPDEARAMAVDDTPSAYAEWFSGREPLFTGIAREADTAVGALRTRELVARADDATEAGRRLLETHLPEQRFSSRMPVFWLVLALLGVVCGGLMLGAVVVSQKSLGVGIVFAGFAALAALGALVIWKRHRWAEFVVNVDGLNHSHWRQPLPFADVESMRLQNHYNFLTLTLRLKTRRPPPWDFTLLRFPRRSVSLVLTWIDADPHALTRTIYRYFTRELSDD